MPEGDKYDPLNLLLLGVLLCVSCDTKTNAGICPRCCCLRSSSSEDQDHPTAQTSLHYADGTTRENTISSQPRSQPPPSYLRQNYEMENFQVYPSAEEQRQIRRELHRNQPVHLPPERVPGQSRFSSRPPLDSPEIAALSPPAGSQSRDMSKTQQQKGKERKRGRSGSKARPDSEDAGYTMEYSDPTIAQHVAAAPAPEIQSPPPAYPGPSRSRDESRTRHHSRDQSRTREGREKKHRHGHKNLKK